MKKLLVGTLLFSTSSVFAQSCPVDVPAPIHIDEKSITVYEAGKPKLLIDKNNNLYINGDKIDLSAVQQQALTAYSDNVQTYLPQMAQLAQEGARVATALLNEVAEGFDSKAAFQNVQTLIDQLSTKAGQKFYNADGEFVLPADVFETMDNDWKAEFEVALKELGTQSVAGLFAALSEQMKQGDLDFTQFQSTFLNIKTRLTEQMAAQSGTMKQKADALCSSIENLAEQEKQLQQVIPQLKDIQMFEI